MSHKEQRDKAQGAVLFHNAAFNANSDGATLVTWPWTARQKRRAAGTRKTRKDARVKGRNL